MRARKDAGPRHHPDLRRAALAALLLATALSAPTRALSPQTAPPPTAAPQTVTPPTATGLSMVATYDVTLHLDWDTRRVKVVTEIDLVNTSGQAVDRLHLNTIAAELGAMRRLDIRVDGSAAAARVRGQTITVPLAGPLADGVSASVRVAYRAQLTRSARGRDFLWSRLGGVAHLYRFIPWLSRSIPFGPHGHGEPFVTPVSPYVRVSASADRDLVWATSGQRISRAGGTSVFEARNVRDFNIAASPGYRTRSGRSIDGQTRIIVRTRSADGRRLLGLAREEIDRYERLTGVQYPYPTFEVAESGAGLAMESPALIWIPGWRSPADQPLLVSHETAHQWFYAIVGNDQAADAFADEALADLLSRRARSSLRASRCRTDRLDRDIGDYSRLCYYEVIYIQGGLFLDGLRRDFGGGRFKRAIRAYARDYAFGMGGDRRLLEALRAEMGDGVLRRYRARFPSLY